MNSWRISQRRRCYSCVAVIGGAANTLMKKRRRVSDSKQFSSVGMLMRLHLECFNFVERH